MGFLGGDIGDLLRHDHHGDIGGGADNVPAVDGVHRTGAVPALDRVGSLPGLRMRVALKHFSLWNPFGCSSVCEGVGMAAFFVVCVHVVEIYL